MCCTVEQFRKVFLERAEIFFTLPQKSIEQAANGGKGSSAIGGIYKELKRKKSKRRIEALFGQDGFYSLKEAALFDWHGHGHGTVFQSKSRYKMCRN